MITTELVGYISNCISQGIAPETIKSSLLSQGWNEQDINLGLSQLPFVQHTSVQPPVKPIPPIQLQTEKPKNIFDFRNLRGFEMLAMLPAIFLLVRGGAVGAAIGFIGWSLSYKIIKSKSKTKIAKLFLVTLITIAYYVLYFIVGSFVIGLIEGLS